MAYDRDGTEVFRLDHNNVLTQASQNIMDYLNNEVDPGSSSSFNNAIGFLNYGQSNTFGWLIFIFPELRDISHAVHTMVPQQFNHGINVDVEWSRDTTNGMDGNWNREAQLPAPLRPIQPYYRDSIETLSLSGVKAVRFWYRAVGAPSMQGIGKVHLYGHKSPGETPHRIDFTYADGSNLVQDFDYGDQSRGTTAQWSPTYGYNVGSGLYLRNRSPDKVANDVVVTITALSLDMNNRLSLSKDNVSFGTYLSWISLQPQQMAGPIYVRHKVEDNTPLGLYTSRLRIDVGEWR